MARRSPLAPRYATVFTVSDNGDLRKQVGGYFVHAYKPMHVTRNAQRTIRGKVR